MMQRTFPGRSAQRFIPAVVVVLALIAGSVFVATGQDQPQTYYACADADGDLKNLRVDAAPECGQKETLVSWESGEVPSWDDLAGIPAAFQDGTIDWTEVEGVPAGFADGVDDGLTSVSWNDVQDVPAGFADDTDNVDGGIAADLQCVECVRMGEIGEGSIVMRNMGPDSVGSTQVRDDILTADDLAENSVGTSELADGAVGTTNLGNGAVTTDKQTANVLSADGGTTHLVSGGAPVPLMMPGTTGFTPGGGTEDTHAVMLTVEIDLRCPECGAGNSATVNIFVEDQANVPIGDKVVVLNESNERASVTINRLLFMPGGTPTEFVIEGMSVATGGTDVIVDRANVIAVDLGDTP